MPRKYSRRRRCKTPMFGRADRYVASKALAYSKKALSMLNVEYKCHDTQLSSLAITTVATIHALTNVAQGDTTNERDGNQMKITRNLLRYSVVGGPADDTLIRVMLVLDKQTNGALYAISDLLQDTSVTDIIISPLNLDNKFRFRVLYDRVHSLSSEGKNSINVSKMFKMGLRIRFDANDQMITDLTSYSLSFVAVANQATNTPNLTLFNRVRFVDN